MNSPEYQPFQHTPEEIALRSSLDVPLLLLPKRGSVFADRALRLRQKAADHAMRDYLMFMAVVCEAQHAGLPQFPQVPSPTQAQIDAAAHEGTALLATDRWPRDPAWRSGPAEPRVLPVKPARSRGLRDAQPKSGSWTHPSVP